MSKHKRIFLALCAITMATSGFIMGCNSNTGETTTDEVPKHAAPPSASGGRELKGMSAPTPRKGKAGMKGTAPTTPGLQ